MLPLQTAAQNLTVSTPNGAASLLVLTNAGEIRRLKREEALRGYPVKIRGVVTCIQPECQAMVIQDSTLGIYVKNCSFQDSVPAQVGEDWEVEGVTDAGFAPMIRPQRVTRLGKGLLPEPVHPTWDQLMNGSLDSQYMELQGIVTAVQPGEVMLLTRGGKIRVHLPGLKPEDIQHDEGALVSLRGCLFAKHEDEKISLQVKLGEIEIHNPSISVVKPAPADLFATPLKRVADLLLFDPEAGAFQRVRVAGQIVQMRDETGYLMDGTNGLRFIPKEMAELQVADLVEVVGFPELGGPSPVLREAVVRKLGQAPLPAPKTLTPDNLFRNDYDSTLVCVEGLLLNLANNGAGQVLELQAGMRKFVARLKAKPWSASAIPIGSRLQLTGVYAAQSGNREIGRDTDSFELLLNSPSDLRILAQPPWWTLERLLAIVGVLAGLLALALVWITLLRRQVEQRAAQLKQEIQECERAEYRHTLEEERSRIARDLHDDLGSTLTEISMLAETGRDQPAPAVDLRKRFDRILGRTQTLVWTLDEIVWAVDPNKDTLPALIRYLAGYAEEYVTAAELACRVELATAVPESPLSAQVRHHLFLEVKEALNNAVRHAQASEVVFRINLPGNELHICITDNGRGFDPAAHFEGNGLANLHQRLASLRGRCEIHSQAGAGTTVLLVLPLDHNPPSL
ncbi:MAG: sensor histidine kinase [Verrucomicrobiota bacterium]|jgi:signal transduction histidine kinase